jgi:hypothetical protein
LIVWDVISGSIVVVDLFLHFALGVVEIVRPALRESIFVESAAEGLLFRSQQVSNQAAGLRSDEAEDIVLVLLRDSLDGVGVEEDVHELYSRAVVAGLVRVSHYLILAIDNSACEQRFGVEEGDELIIDAHECLVVVGHVDIVEDDGGEEEEVNACDL